MANIFISYRRDGGEAVAQLVNDRLKNSGFQVFYDIESLHSGDFNKALYDHIDACDYFVLILSPQALDRCINEEDWVRKEIVYANQQGKKIIPMFTRGFTFPSLPEELVWLPNQNGVQLDSMMYLDSAIQKLISYFDIESSPQTSAPTEQKKRNLDEEIRKNFQKTEEEQSDPGSTLLKRMSEKLLKSYFDRLVSVSGAQDSNTDFHKSNTLILQYDGKYVGEHFALPIINGKIFLASDDSIDIQAFAIYGCGFDPQSKMRKARAAIYEMDKKETQGGVLLSVAEYLECYNKYSRFGNTTVLTFTEPMEQRPLFNEETNKWLNGKINKLGKFPLVNVITNTGFGEDRFFLIVLNHVEHQIVQILPAYYSKGYGKGRIKEYVVIDVDSRIDMPYRAPKKVKSAVMAQRKDKIRTYMADVDATTILYDPISREIILRYISEDGTPEVSFNSEHTLISIPISSTLKDVEAGMMTAYELGKCYFDGTCEFPRNVFKAMQFFEEDGNADSLYEAGFFLYQDEELGDKEMAFEYLLKAALMGNRKSLTYVHILLKNKTGHISDLEQFKRLCEISKAAIEEVVGSFKVIAINRTASLYSMLAGIYYEKREYLDAIKFDNQAVAIFTEMPPLNPGTWRDDDLQQATYMYRLGLDYYMDKQYELAEEYLYKARQLVLKEYYRGIDWNRITVGILHCKIMRFLALTYGEMRQHTKRFRLSQALVTKVKELTQIKAEDIFAGKNLDVAERLITDNSHLLRFWLINDLIDLGWSAYVVGDHNDVAESSAKEAISLIEDCEKYRRDLCSAYYLLSHVTHEGESEMYWNKAKELDSNDT